MKDDFFGLAWKVTANITGWIAGPVIIGLFLGRWLDQKFNTAPWLFLLTIGLCFVISMFGLVSYALKEFKKIEDDARAAKLKTEAPAPYFEKNK